MELKKYLNEASYDYKAAPKFKIPKGIILKNTVEDGYGKMSVLFGDRLYGFEIKIEAEFNNFEAYDVSVNVKHLEFIFDNKFIKYLPFLEWISDTEYNRDYIYYELNKLAS